MTGPSRSQDLASPASDESLDFLKRGRIVDADGVAFSQFRRSLTPRYGIVWSHLALGYLALLLGGAFVILTVGSLHVAARVAWGAIWIGFFQAYIQLFFHEAAHYNFAPGRENNDRLANIFIGAVHGLDIDTYRKVHFEHHRKLGTMMDSERAYFDPLNVRFIVEGLLGVKAMRVIQRRDAVLDRLHIDKPTIGPRQKVTAALIHGAIVATAIAANQYALAAAWVIGTLSIMPLMVAARQLLEHRSEEAENDKDYSTVDHGPVNRLFGDGPVASTFGGAGFNRHLLHHWEPQISYTRLRDVERYLLRTDVKDEIVKRRTTYFETFWALISW